MYLHVYVNLLFVRRKKNEFFTDLEQKNSLFGQMFVVVISEYSCVQLLDNVV